MASPPVTSRTRFSVADNGPCVGALNPNFMYFPDPTRVAPEAAGLNGVKEIELTVADGTILIAWHTPAKDDKPTIIYFHDPVSQILSKLVGF